MRRQCRKGEFRDHGSVGDPHIFRISPHHACAAVKMPGSRAGGGLKSASVLSSLKLLTILTSESPRVVSRRDIEREVLRDVLPDSDTLHSHLYNLRKMIDRPFQNQLLQPIHPIHVRSTASTIASASPAAPAMSSG